jgi:hypothetical protein
VIFAKTFTAFPHATGAAPTGRRRGAGQAAEIGRRLSDRRSRSSNREFHFAELGTFALEPGTFAREQGGYCANPGTFSICSTVSFRQLLGQLLGTCPARMRQLRLMNTLKFIPFSRFSCFGPRLSGGSAVRQSTPIFSAGGSMVNVSLIREADNRQRCTKVRPFS